MNKFTKLFHIKAHSQVSFIMINRIRKPNKYYNEVPEIYTWKCILLPVTENGKRWLLCPLYGYDYNEKLNQYAIRQGFIFHNDEIKKVLAQDIIILPEPEDYYYTENYYFCKNPDDMQTILNLYNVK